MSISMSGKPKSHQDDKTDVLTRPRDSTTILAEQNYHDGHGLKNLYYNRALLQHGAQNLASRLSTKWATIGVVSALIVGAAYGQIEPPEQLEGVMADAYGVTVVVAVAFNLASIITSTIYINHITMLMVTDEDIIWFCNHHGLLIDLPDVTLVGGIALHGVSPHSVMATVTRLRGTWWESCVFVESASESSPSGPSTPATAEVTTRCGTKPERSSSSCEQKRRVISHLF